MDLDGRETVAVDGADSLRKDRSSPSSGRRAHIVERSTDKGLFDDRHIHRQGTDERERWKPNKRVRYTIPLRYSRNGPKDEEKGLAEEEAFGNEYYTRCAIERGTSRGLRPQETLEIVSTQWIPDDEGREMVKLTVKDTEGLDKSNQQEIRCESRWTHIRSEAMTFLQFQNHVMRLPQLGNDDLALVARLLNKVQKTCEKHFVHGRYLKPVTLVYEGEDRDQISKVRKTATFINLPVFTTDYPHSHITSKEFEGHPVRALLQSRYRLESTKRRENEQVIAKIGSKNNQVVHVPQIWALVINKHTIVTCAPLNVATLRGETINLISYADAQLDEATWSVHFTDTHGNVFYLPIRFCRSWFGLIKQICDDCLDDEFNFVQDQLLKDGPLYSLFAKDGTNITAESWPKMVEEKKTEVIHLMLVDHQGAPGMNRLLVTYFDNEGNEMIRNSDSSSDTSSIFSSDEDESSSTNSSNSTTSDLGNVAAVVDKLRRLHGKLQEAKTHEKSKKTGHINTLIATLEDRILALAAEGSAVDTSRQQYPAERKAKASNPDRHVRWQQSSDDSSQSAKAGDNDPEGAANLGADVRDEGLDPSFITDDPTYRRRGSATEASTYSTPGRLESEKESRPSIKEGNRSERSTSRPRSTALNHENSRSTSDLSLDGAKHRGRATQHISIHDRNRSVSQPRRRHVEQFDYYAASRPSSRPRSLLQNTLPLSQASSIPVSPQLRWESVRSRVLGGQIHSREDDIYYKPSDKQIARSRWDFVRSKILEGGSLGLNNHGAVQRLPEDGPSPSNADSDPVGATPSPHIETLDPQLNSKLDVTNSHLAESAQPKPKKREMLKKQLHEGKPMFKKFIRLALGKALATPKLNTPTIANEVSISRSLKESRDLPMFLWPTKHEPPKVNKLDSRMLASLAGPEQSNNENFLQTLIEGERAAVTPESGDFILHTLLAEVHGNLKKHKRASPEYAALYEKIINKSFGDMNSFMDNLKHFRSHGQNNSIDDESQRTSGLTPTKMSIFDSAVSILNAFVPEGYDAPVISKYWGALYSLLQEKDDSVVRYIRRRLSDICHLIRGIQMGVRSDNENKQQYVIPRALPWAFQHLVMLLAIISEISVWSDHSWCRMQTAFDDCETLLVEGRKQLILMIHTDDYRETAGFQAVDSEALLSLILANLVANLSTEGDFHLTDIYSEYTTFMQSRVRDRASVKVYDDIKLLNEEIDIIKMTLNQQHETLRDFRSTISITYGVLSLSVSVIDRMLESVEQRIDDFDELQLQAETASFLAHQSISLKAESNNKAIIVFTLVTIIFLPLSFVTSYLGMNTSDIRSMQNTQNLFWAIGVPVAFVILSAALMVAFYGTLTQRITGRAWRSKEKAD